MQTRGYHAFGVTRGTSSPRERRFRAHGGRETLLVSDR
jgi:hypothetical protein